jgi:phosphonatase-like hydrolase
MNELKMVVFDMAGTTVRDEHEVEDCFAAAAAECGINMTESEIKSVQGWSKRFVFESYWKKHIPENTPEFNEKVEWSYQKFKEILEDHYRTNPVYPTEGCLETFEWLKKNKVHVALSTGFYRKVTNIILNKLGWLEGLDDTYKNVNNNAIIDFSIASDEVSEGRPAPDMILACMNAFQIDDPKKVIAIGDTPSDIQAGHAASCLRTVALTNGTHTEEQLIAFKPNILLNSLTEFPNFLIEQNFIQNANYTVV